MRPTPNGLFLILGALCLQACNTSEPRIETVQRTVDMRLAETRPAAAQRPGLADDVHLALRMAVEGNGEYIAALAAEREAMAGIGAAKSMRRPVLTAGSTVGGVREGSPSNDTLTGATADIMLSQLIYDGGAARATIDQATASAIATRANAQDTGNRIALDAYRAWVGLWLAQEQKRLLQARTGELQTIEAQLDRMTESGMIDSSLRESARLAQIDMDMQRARLQGSLRAAEAAFLRHFDTVPPTVDCPAPLLSGKDRNVDPAAWKNSPSLRRLAAELVAAEAATLNAKAAFRPVVSLRTGVSSPMDPEDTTDASLGVQIQYTLGDGGRRKARIAAAEAREEGLRAQLADAQLQAESLLASATATLAALERSAALVSDKVGASATQADTAGAQIALGQSTLAALMEAHITNYRASEQQLQVTAEQLVLQAEIAAGTGKLLAALGLAE